MLDRFKFLDLNTLTHQTDIQHEEQNQQQQQEDVEDKNLSWLLNFKLDELPHLSPEAKRKALNVNSEGNGQEKACFEDDDTNVAENIIIENTAKA